MSGNVTSSPYNPFQQSGVRAKNPPDMVVAFRAPTTKDYGFFPGTLWLYAKTALYVMGGFNSSTSASWLILGTTPASGIATINGISPDGGGDFGIVGTSLQITVTAGVNSVVLSIPNTFSIGSVGGADSGTILVGSGGLTINGASGAAFAVGASLTTGTIVIGGTAQTGAITLGSSSGTNIVNVGTGAGATTVNIASGATSAKAVNIGTGAIGNVITIGSVTAASSLSLLVGTGNFSLNGAASSTYAIGASTTTGTITIGGTAQTGTITLGSSSGTNIVAIGAGTGATTVNIAGGATSAKAVNIATGAVANVVVIGSTTGAASLTLQSGSAGIVATGIMSFSSSLFSAGGAIATTATDGFIYSASCAGTPTGVPTVRGAAGADVPFIFDTSTGTGKLWAYIGGSWVGVALS